jgi:hypothetical protein
MRRVFCKAGFPSKREIRRSKPNIQQCNVLFQVGNGCCKTIYKIAGNALKFEIHVNDVKNLIHFSENTLCLLYKDHLLMAG